MDHIAQDARFLLDQFPALLVGFLVTLGVAAASAPLALGLGLLLLAPRMAAGRAARAATLGYIELMRNTPLLVQMYLIYFGAPVLGIFPSEFACGVTAIALQHAAFLVEIYRSGIDSVSSHQWDAARALGMSRAAVLRIVVLPQALRRVLGPLANQLIVLVKDTSLVSAIGVVELTMAGRMAIERSAASTEIFVAVALFYLVLTTLVGGAMRLMEAWALERQ